MTMEAQMKSRRKRKKEVLMKKTLITEELMRFIPPVSRMGGTNPVDWRWGMKAGELRPERLNKKEA